MPGWINLTTKVLVELLPVHFQGTTDMSHRAMLIADCPQILCEILIRHNSSFYTKAILPVNKPW